MHYLQKTILDKLRYEQPLAYTALMPEDIESSHFRYHLKQLIADGLIDKDQAGGYVLSNKGQREVDYLSNNRTTIIRTPKVITYTLLTHNSKVLLYKKPKEPYRNLWGMIGGKVHFGEDTQQAAKREVYEKTGMTVELPTFCGVADVVIYKDDEPLSHVVAYVYILDLQELPATLAHGLRLIDPAKLDAYDLIADLKPLLDGLHTSDLPFVKQIRCST